MTRSLLTLVLGVVVFGIGLQQVLQLRSHSQSRPGSATPEHALARKPIVRVPARRFVRITVDGLNFTFSPASITVAAGASITWVNETASPHTVTSVTPRLFDASVPGHGTARLHFNRSGTFQYYCALHPYMLGIVHVRP